MRISDWSSDVCSSDLLIGVLGGEALHQRLRIGEADILARKTGESPQDVERLLARDEHPREPIERRLRVRPAQRLMERSEEHTSELQSLMRISYAVFCLKKKKKNNHSQHTTSKTIIHKSARHIKSSHYPQAYN